MGQEWLQRANASQLLTSKAEQMLAAGSSWARVLAGTFRAAWLQTGAGQLLCNPQCPGV